MTRTYRAGIAETHPHLMETWDTERNTLDPSVVTAGSHKVAYWTCHVSEEHKYEAKVWARTGSRPQGCPYCAGKRVSISGSLATTHPDLMAEWDYERNSLDPTRVSFGSHKVAYWRCPKGDDHRWDMPIKARTLGGYGCPCCSGQRVVLSNSLATTHPELLESWDYERNSLDPTRVSFGSGKVAHWRCPNGEDHRWTSKINQRVLCGCPVCNNRKAVASNCLATTHPHLVAEWDYERNANRPEDFCSGSNTKAHWRCPVADDHRWIARITSRASAGKGCPFCQGLRVATSNCLATTHPHLLAEWDYERNKYKPTDFVAGSNKKAHWKCSKGHRWEALIISRSYGIGCPLCKESRGEKRIEETLKELGVTYRREFKFRQCVNKRVLPFDFALATFDGSPAVIEYHGRQHYKVIEWFGGEKQFKMTQTNDAIKREFCRRKQVKYLEIPYTEYDNIPSLVKGFVKGAVG